MSSIIILSIVLGLSLIFNGLMYWYSRQLTSKLAFIYDNIGDVSELIANYRVHLKSVYSMEMFYGDETLQFLMDHTRSIGSLLEEFEDKYAPQQQEELTDGETTQTQQKDVFYAGTRRRDS